MTSFPGVPVDAAYHLVAGFTSFLTPVLGGAAAVAAIILFTMAVRASSTTTTQPRWTACLPRSPNLPQTAYAESRSGRLNGAIR